MNATAARRTASIPAAQVFWLLAVLVLAAALGGCAQATPSAQPEGFNVTVDVDGESVNLTVPVGTTVQNAVDQAGIALNNLDRLDPPSYTLLSSGAVVKVTRVRETFTIQEKVIPFEVQNVRNESLPEGQTLLVQAGVNGHQQVTYRQVFENDVEVSNSVFKTETITESQPEIMMIGVQKPFSPIPIPGRLVYLSGGNAWVMEKTTGDRRPLVTTMDLDGDIFSLSPDGQWLLFTRKVKTPAEAGAVENINSLWAISLVEKNAAPVNLRVDNVHSYAEWVPGKPQTLLYSTVEPRTTEPGWQANNDLHELTFTSSGVIAMNEEILPVNAGGVYGWWGTTYSLSPDGSLLAYARPDGIGLVNRVTKELTPLVDILPLQTGSSWAWVTGLGWAPDSRVLYFVSHAPKAGLDNQETSPLFDVSALPLIEQAADGKSTFTAGPAIQIVPQAGMFAYPAPAPTADGSSYQVAFLQAIFPEQSDTKRYRLVVMDRDGSNPKTLFPPQDSQGLAAQQLTWSPAAFENGSRWLAVIYQKNLWLVDSQGGQSQQITGDGLIDWVDWQ